MLLSSKEAMTMLSAKITLVPKHVDIDVQFGAIQFRVFALVERLKFLVYISVTTLLLT